MAAGAALADSALAHGDGYFDPARVPRGGQVRMPASFHPEMVVKGGRVFGITRGAVHPDAGEGFAQARFQPVRNAPRWRAQHTIEG